MPEAPIERMLAMVDWKALDLTGARFTDEPDALYATHEGTVEFGAAKLRCYQLNDGSRVFDADDVAAFFTPPWPPFQQQGGRDA